jgi:HAD superfamily hydrolase (TIGR01662 family)
MINRPEEARKHRSGNAKAVFLDRDGVLNQHAQEHEYIRSVSEFRILPGVPEAISRLTSAGLLVLVVTNQRGIACELVSKRRNRAYARISSDRN